MEDICPFILGRPLVHNMHPQNFYQVLEKKN